MAAAPPPTAPVPALTSTPRAWTYCDLIKDVLTSEEDIMYWLQRKNLLASSMDCPKCASSCRMVKRKSSFSWRCPRKGCQAVVSARDKSFFSKSKLSFATILKLMYLWSRQTRLFTIAIAPRDCTLVLSLIQHQDVHPLLNAALNLRARRYHGDCTKCFFSRVKLSLHLSIQ